MAAEDGRIERVKGRTEMAEYPHQDGDHTVIGPECFASEDGSVICWKGENYERQSAHPDRRREQEGARGDVDSLRDAFALMNEYQRANLRVGLRVLRAIGLDTGDWLAELLNVLVTLDPGRQANQSVDQQLDAVKKRYADSLQPDPEDREQEDYPKAECSE